MNPSGTSYGLTRSFTMPPLPFTAWKSVQLGDPNAPDLGDPDADGVANLLEYTLLLQPTVPDAEALPAAFVNAYPDGTRLAILVARDPAHYDATIEVQAAASLAGPWAVVASSTNGAPFIGPGYVSGENGTAGAKLVEIRDVVNVGSAPRRFLRVQVKH